MKVVAKATTLVGQDMQINLSCSDNTFELIVLTASATILHAKRQLHERGYVREEEHQWTILETCAQISDNQTLGDLGPFRDVWVHVSFDPLQPRDVREMLQRCQVKPA